MLADIHERLAHVVIEQLGYAEFIQRYDRPDLLFYLDPPYWDCEADYGAGVFERADFARLAAVLAGIRGRFLLSINDTAGVRECFAAFNLVPIETTYSISTATSGPKRVGELFVSNFALPPV
jgi:DNA adenine methylase